MFENTQSRFASRKTISLSNKELIDAVLADRKAVLGQEGKYQIDGILINEAPPLFSGNHKDLEVIIKEHYCDEDAVTVMLRGILHSLEGKPSSNELISPVMGKLTHFIQLHIPSGRNPKFEVAPDIIAPSTKNHLLMYVGHYLGAITENPHISELVRANLQAAWTTHMYIFAGTLSPGQMSYLLTELIDNMKYPGMVMHQVYLLSALVDCLVFPNTPESRLDIITAIQ